MRTPTERHFSEEQSEAYFWEGLTDAALDTFGPNAGPMLCEARESGNPWPVVDALKAGRTLAAVALEAEAA